MPMFGTTLYDETGRPMGIACHRGRRSAGRCSVCAVPRSELECDGCDKALCKTCAVSPRAGLDFCPTCFDPAWKRWLGMQPSSAAAMTRERRRAEFRAWARAACNAFLSLVKLSPTSEADARSRRAMGLGLSPHALWKQAGGVIIDGVVTVEADRKKYTALLVEHGFLVPKETTP